MTPLGQINSASDVPLNNGTLITDKTAVTADGADYVLISDTSDSGNLKKALASDFGGSGGLTYQQILSTVSLRV